MDIKIYPSRLEGTVPVVSSKSDVHRALICAALSDGPTDIACNLFSADIEATARCLTAAGAKISADKAAGLLRVEPFSKAPSRNKAVEEEEQKEAPPALFCGESGSTLRFLLPVMAARGARVSFSGAGELPRRPLSVLLSALREHGVRAEICSPVPGESLPLLLSGKLQSGSFHLPGDISSQYVTGLLLSLPLLSGPSEICLETPLQSAAYVDMTIDTMARFGVQINRTAQGFSCAGGAAAYRSPGVYHSDGDWSNAAFWLCADRMEKGRRDHTPEKGENKEEKGAGEERKSAEKALVSVSGLRTDSLQGDRRISALLDQYFGDEAPGMREGMQGKERVIDASGIPDLVPPLAALAAVSSGTTRFVRAERLRLKECDRLSALSDVLGRMGAGIGKTADGLLISGAGGALSGGCTISGHNDHRIVMAAAIAAAHASAPVVIEGAEAVRKSYPHFFEDFRSIGGCADVIDLR